MLLRNSSIVELEEAAANGGLRGVDLEDHQRAELHRHGDRR